MLVKSVPTKGWTRGTVEATIRLVTQQQRHVLAERVRSEMERQNLTNALLAHRAGVAEKTISRIINARLAPRYGTVERVSRGLGLDERALWAAVGEMPTMPRLHATPDLSVHAAPDVAKRLNELGSAQRRAAKKLAEMNAKLDQALALLSELGADGGEETQPATGTGA